MQKELKERAQFWAIILLIVDGMILTVPALSDGILTLTGGRVWIHVILGVLSLVAGVVLFGAMPRDTN